MGMMQQQAVGGDAAMRKVFVGGLAWETHRDALRDYFLRFGDILEVVIISDKLTGRSKGYGFVTFKEAEAARKACEDAMPLINGRRANCNLASLGAKPRHPPATAEPTHQPSAIAVGPRGVVSPVPWYYHPSSSSTPPPPPPTHYNNGHQYHGVLPFYPTATSYGYSPNYVADFSYNAQKLGQAAAGPYLQGHFFYPAPQGGMVPSNGVLPMYPFYHYHHPGVGVPAAHFFPPVTAAAAVISKAPTAMPPPKVEQVTGCS